MAILQELPELIPMHDQYGRHMPEARLFKYIRMDRYNKAM